MREDGSTLQSEDFVEVKQEYCMSSALDKSASTR